MPSVDYLAFPSQLALSFRFKQGQYQNVAAKRVRMRHVHLCSLVIVNWENLSQHFCILSLQQLLTFFSFFFLFLRPTQSEIFHTPNFKFICHKFIFRFVSRLSNTKFNCLLQRTTSNFWPISFSIPTAICACANCSLTPKNKKADKEMNESPRRVYFGRATTLFCITEQSPAPESGHGIRIRSTPRSRWNFPRNFRPTWPHSGWAT